jgi:hypothetical protein
VPWLGHSPEQVTIAAAGLDDESVDFMRHGIPAPDCTKGERQTTHMNAWKTRRIRIRAGGYAADFEFD